MPTLTVHIINCWLKGNEWSDLGARKIRNRIPLSLGRFNAVLVRTPESYDFTVGEMQDRQVHTTNLEFSDVSHADLKTAKKYAVYVAELLSFALSSQVAVWGFTYEGHTQTYQVRGKLKYFRPTFGPAQGPEIKSFLEVGLPIYRRLRLRRKLHVIFDYLTTAELSDLPIEIKFLLTAVALESLKTTFAHGAGIPFKSGHFRKVSTPPKPNLSREPTYSFAELVKLMSRAVGMRPSTRRIITLRNYIIHSGTSERPAESISYSFFFTQDIILEYLLRLLGFHGRVHSYREPGEYITL